MAVADHLARYRGLERIGVGGMATVTLAMDTMLQRRVALKRVHAGGDARAISRLRREALVGASLSHPNLVSIYDVETSEDGDLVIVMEYVPGRTLRQLIDAGGGLPEAFALEILDGVAAALDAIHARGIVHRDVKPANILLGREGAVKLADLGIAVVADRTQITQAGEILGTYSYMAPEQLDGAAATPAVDVYALAVVAFEMLSGEKAWPQDNPLALAHAIVTGPPPDLCALAPGSSPAVAAVLKRGMAADPAKRPPSAGALVERLRSAIDPPRTTEPVAPPTFPVAPAPARPEPGRSAAAPRPPREPRPAAMPAPPRPESGRPAAAALPPPREPRPAAMPAPPPAAAGSRGRRARLEGSRLRSVLILAGIAAFGLAILALALLDSGGTTPPRTAAHSRSTAQRTPASAGRTATSASSSRSTSTGSGGGGAPAGASAAGAAATSGAGPSTAAAGAGSPPSAVETFYTRAAAHDYAGAWALADPSFRAQLRDYSSFVAGQSQVRRITFQQARVVAQGSQTATVYVRTTSELVSRTEHCFGPVQLVRSTSGGWLLHQISINCV